MATKITTKKRLFGNNRSKALNATRRSQKVNFQKVTLPSGETIVTSAREAKKYKKAEKMADKKAA